MFHKPGRRLIGLAGAALALAGALLAPGRLFAADTLCAVVKLQISQTATFERQAFSANLSITNSLTTPLSNLQVQIIVKDAQGNPAPSAFFINVSSLTGTNGIDGSGVVQPNSSAQASWLLIPSSGTGGTTAAGQVYAISAFISSLSGTQPQSLQTFPVNITVMPQPLLSLQYVLPYEVFGQEPLRPDIITQPIPFPLGLRVANIGYGPANNFQVTSAQPEIVDNAQGLLQSFNITGTVVGGQAQPNSLLVTYGNLPAQGAGLAEWTMTTSLSGYFINFASTFSHAASLGGVQTSLVQDVTTYTLIKDALDDRAGHDAISDFLVNASVPRSSMTILLDGGSQPPAELLLESDSSASIPVATVGSALSGALSGTNAALTLTLPSAPSGAWVYTYVPFVYGSSGTITSAQRSDGKTISLRNVWISKHFVKSTLSYVYWLNLLDYAAGPLTYTIQFSPAGLSQPPAAVTDLAAATGAQGGSLSLNWTAPGDSGSSGLIVAGHYLVAAATDPAASFAPSAAAVDVTTTTAPGNPENFLISGLAGNATYYLRLWTQNSDGLTSPVSAAAAAYVLPNPPSSLAFTSISSGALSSTWQAGNNLPPVSYAVSLSNLAGGTPLASSPLSDSVFNFNFEGLTPNTSYFAYGLGTSPASGAASPSILLGTAVTLAAVPEAAAFGPVFASSLTVNWLAGGNPPDTQFLVQLSTDPAFSAVAAASPWVAAASYSFSGLTSNQTYHARVKARSRTGAETAYAPLGSAATAIVDFLPPRTALAAGTPSFSSATIYATAATIFSLTSVDDMLAVGDGIGLGVGQTFLAIDAAAFSVYGGTFSLVDEGTHTVSFYSADVAGHVAAASSAAVALDLTPPVSALQIQGSSTTNAQGLALIASTTLLGLSAADPVSNGAASGVGAILYVVDDDPFSPACQAVALDLGAPAGTCANKAYGGPFALSVGTHTVYYFAKDNVGNREAVRSLAIRSALDTAPPTIAAAVSPAPTAAGWTSVVPTTVTFSCTQGLSGGGVCPESVYLTSETTGTAVSGSITDGNGLTAAASVIVKIDTTAPTIAAAVSPLPNDKGWNSVLPATVTFSCGQGISGGVVCPGPVYLADMTTGTVVSGSVSADNGLSASASVVVRIDTEAPAIAVSVSPAPNGDGWIGVLPATVAFSCALGISSGSCPEPVYLISETTGTTVSGAAEGNNGLGAAASAMVKIDTTVPTIAAVVSPAPNADGWTSVIPTTVTFTCGAGISGAFCPAPVYLTSETTGTIVSATVTAKNGLSATTSVLVKIDMAGPAVAISSPTANANGWYNSDVTVSFSGQDSGSGIASCSAPETLSTDGAGQSTSGSCTDKAGNTTLVTVSGINIDKAGPAIEVSSPTANANGWYNADVTVSFSGQDSGSGIASCAAPETLSTDGAGQSANGSCTDKAGNTTSVTVSGINISKSPPAVFVASPTANANGWYNTNVAVSFSAADTLSGRVTCVPDAFTFSSEGAGQSVASTCTDPAGNSSQKTVSGVNIDKTAPTITVSSPTANANGWYNSDVTVAFSGQDSGSGIASCSAPETLSADGAGQSASGSCTDKAGNTTSAAVSGINIDKTAPAISFAVSPAANANGWNSVLPVTVTFTCASGISGGSCPAPVSLTSETMGTVVTGSITGNNGLSVSTSVVVRIDAASPSISAAVSPALSAAGWSTVVPTTVTFSCVAGISGGNCPGPVYLTSQTAGTTVSGTITDANGLSASASVVVKIATVPPTIAVTVAPTPNDDGWTSLLPTTVTFNCGQGFSGGACPSPIYLMSQTSGTVVSGTITDASGLTASASIVVKIDTAAPATALTTQSGVSFSRFGQIYVTPDTLFVLTAADNFSGVRVSSYSIDGTALRAYAAPFSLAEGTHTISCFSQDLAGNVEAAQSRVYNVGVFLNNGLSATKLVKVAGKTVLVGQLMTNGGLKGSGGALIQGDVIAASIDLDGKSSINGRQTIAANSVNPAPFDLAAALSSATASNRNADIAAYLNKDGVLVMSGGSLTLKEGNYLITGIRLSGTAVVTVQGKVGVFLRDISGASAADDDSDDKDLESAGPVNLSGSSRLNDGSGADNLAIFSDSKLRFLLRGDARMGAFVYAPQAVVRLEGDSDFGGHIFARSAVFNGTSDLSSGLIVPAIRLAFADPTFKLGEVYAFPNPAKRANPTIHVEVGVAESVDIHIYDIAGSLVKSVTLSDPPGVIDDGSGRGPQYAYEWAWDVSGTGSGIYIYVVTAHNGTNTLKATKKAAVLR